MSMLLHHSTESGSESVLTDDSPVSERSLSQSLPTGIPAFEGRDCDLTTGLQHNLHRWYDPTPGRYLNEEPIG